MELGDGDIYCSIDDDGAFAHDSCLSIIADAFQADPQLGLLAGKIKDYRDGKERFLLPFGKKALKRDPSLPEVRLNAAIPTLIVICRDLSPCR